MGMDIMNPNNIFFQLPLAAILSTLIVLKFMEKPDFNKSLLKLILKGISIGVGTALVLPVLVVINTFANYDTPLVTGFIEKNFLLHFFILSLFVLVGILSGISISVYKFNENNKEIAKK